jgi:hypothetical protein
MDFGPGQLAQVRPGAEVIGADGKTLGQVREIQPHFLLVGRAGHAHEDRQVPVRSILRIEGGVVHVHVTAESVTELDDEETVHRRLRDDA